jgi:hypothetical protein
VLPGIIKMMIGWPFSPFTHLLNSGVFTLFDGIIGWPLKFFAGIDMVAIFPFSPPLAVIIFVQEGTIYVAESLNLSPSTLQQINQVAESSKNDQKGLLPEVNAAPKTKDEQEDETMTNLKNAQEDAYQECLEEKLVTIVPEMSIVDKYKASSMNQSAQAYCKLNQLQSSFSVVAGRVSDKMSNIKK